VDAAAWDRRYAGTALLWSAEPNQFVVEQVAGLPPGRALDIGSGEGRNSVWLATHGWRVTGVDFSSVGLGKARELAHRFGATPEWIEADLTRWTPEFAAYDLILVCYVHLKPDERRSLLRAASAALVPGGTLLVLGHDRTNIGTGTSGPSDPELLLDADEVLDDLAGGPPLRLVRAGRTMRRVTVNGHDRHAVDAYVVGVRPRARPGDGDAEGEAAAARIPTVLPPKGYTVAHRFPTPSELRRLRTAAGLPDPGPSAAQDALANTLAGLCVEAEAEPGRAVACGRIVGDGRTFLVVLDVAVDPSVDSSTETEEFLAALRAPEDPGAAAPGSDRTTGGAARNAARVGRHGTGIVAVVLAELSAWAAAQADNTAFVGVATRTGVQPIGRSMESPA
jgi:SAM-dependent methyltransferase